jgi:hypothetical protein
VFRVDCSSSNRPIRASGGTKISRATSEATVFVVELDGLERFCGEVSSLLPKLKLTAECADKLVRTFESFEDFRASKNPKRSAIQELTLHAHDEAYQGSFRLTLNSASTKNCLLLIDAEESTALKLNDACIDFVDAMRPWYSWVAKADWQFIVFGGWILVMIGSAAIFLFKYGNQPIHFPSTGLPARTLVSPLMIGSFLGLLPIFVGIALNMLRDRAFPRGVGGGVRSG